MDKQVSLIKAVGFVFFPEVIYQQDAVRTGVLVQPKLEGTLVRLAISRIRQRQDLQGYQHCSD